LITGSVATLARVVQISTSIITVPLTLKYLGNERFGLWMTISSVLAMASFADFGIGNGVLNTVSEAFGKDDMTGVRKAVSSGFAILSSIAALLLLSFFIIFRFINWGDFFRVASSQARVEAGPALAVFATCFALNISMDVVQRVQLGLQQGYRYSLWQLCGSTMGFIGVLGGIRLQVSLPVLVMAVAGVPILATALNAMHFFFFVRPDLRPSVELVSRDTISQIAKLGSFFFVLQVVVGVSFSADNFIVARTLGALSVPEYSIPQRMFALITMMSGMLVAPLWPAYGEAISRGHIRWVRHTLRSSLLMVLGATSVASCILLLFSHRLIYWWVGSRIHPSFLLLLGLAIWTVIGCCGDALAMFMNGAGIVRFQVVVASIFGIVCVTTKVLFVHHFGIVGIPWATISAYVMFTALPCALYIPFFIRRLSAATAVLP
jgi:O-antigen/teichoic acid export membrane protein